MSNQPRRRGPMGGGHGRMGTGEKAKRFQRYHEETFLLTLVNIKSVFFLCYDICNRKYGFQYYWTKGSRKSDDRNFQRSGRKSIRRQRN